MDLNQINTRNQFRGTVIEIVFGDVMSEVEVETSSGVISAVITTSSARRLGLQIGDPALVLFKAADVLVARLPP